MDEGTDEMKNTDTKAAARAILSVCRIVEEINRLAADVERLAVENSSLLAECGRLRERVERPEKKLRELAVGDFDDGRFYDCGEVEIALGLVDYGSWYEEADVLRLADLIEPEERTCKVTYEYSGKQFPHCIHVKELSCGHEFRYYEPSYVPNFCPECGAKVVEE